MANREIRDTLDQVDTNQDNFNDYKNAEGNYEEVAIARLTEEDFMLLARESLRFKSWTTFRIFLIMVVQGCNQFVTRFHIHLTGNSPTKHKSNICTEQVMGLIGVP
jgi:hypothetical protein